MEHLACRRMGGRIAAHSALQLVELPVHGGCVGTWVDEVIHYDLGSGVVHLVVGELKLCPQRSDVIGSTRYKCPRRQQHARPRTARR